MKRTFRIFILSTLLLIAIIGPIMYVISLKFNLESYVVIKFVIGLSFLVSAGTAVLVSVNCLIHLSPIRDSFKKKVDAVEDAVFSDNDDPALVLAHNMSPVEKALTDLTKWVTETYPALKKKERELNTKKQELGIMTLQL